jgi:hypothetical protein
VRDECLNEHWFTLLAEARVLIEQWRQDYNEQRPHSALENRTPLESARAAASPHGGCEEMESIEQPYPSHGVRHRGTIRPIRLDVAAQPHTPARATAGNSRPAHYELAGHP